MQFTVPLSAAYPPAAHDEQADIPCIAYVPSEQRMGNDAPFRQKEPALHPVHSTVPVPVAYAPASHNEQADIPCIA